MTTKHIEEFLQHFSDQRLANLQCATEDGTLEYRDSRKCLLHHYEGNYLATRFGTLSQLSERAQVEFVKIGWADDYRIEPTEKWDARRRERLLPLIHAEWARRARPVPVTFETPAKQEVLVHAPSRQS